MPECPLCGKDNQTILNEWNYARFHVKNIQCNSCKYSFKAYFKDGKFSHTIINGYKLSLDERRVINYMKENKTTTVEKLSYDLTLLPDSVEAILEKLEKLGHVIGLPST